MLNTLQSIKDRKSEITKGGEWVSLRGAERKEYKTLCFKERMTLVQDLGAPARLINHDKSKANE